MEIRGGLPFASCIGVVTSGNGTVSPRARATGPELSCCFDRLSSLSPSRWSTHSHPRVTQCIQTGLPAENMQRTFRRRPARCSVSYLSPRTNRLTSEISHPHSIQLRVPLRTCFRLFVRDLFIIFTLCPRESARSAVHVGLFGRNWVAGRSSYWHGGTIAGLKDSAKPFIRCFVRATG